MGKIIVLLYKISKESAIVLDEIKKKLYDMIAEMRNISCKAGILPKRK